MTRTWRSIAVVLALCLGSTRAAADPAPEPRYGPCRAERVIDGNTAEVRCGGEVLRVRLVHVASPQPGDTGHFEAGRALRALLAGRELWLAFERSGRPTLDRDGVLLVHLYDRAGQNLNIALVSAGWASYAATDGDDPLARRFQLAEREARAERRAMWSVWTYTVRR